MILIIFHLETETIPSKHQKGIIIGHSLLLQILVFTEMIRDSQINFKLR